MYTVSGTEWPYMCWSAIKNLLTHSLTQAGSGSASYSVYDVWPKLVEDCYSLLGDDFVFQQDDEEYSEMAW